MSPQAKLGKGDEGEREKEKDMFTALKFNAAHNDSFKMHNSANKALGSKLFVGNTADKAVTTKYNPAAMLT